MEARASLTAPWVLSLLWTARRYSLTARSRWPVQSKMRASSMWMALRRYAVRIAAGEILVDLDAV